MRAQLAEAPVGDDYYGEDPSASKLESRCNELFGVEASLFCTSGMLANQLAVQAQTSRGDEVITGYGYHLNQYESAQHAAFSGVVLNGRETPDGVLRPEDVLRAIESKPRDAIYAQARLVTVENTISSQQGKVLPLAELHRLRDFTRAHGLRLHLDGARLLNAHIATGTPLAEWAREADTVSVCFSKGLGAPVGSILMGDKVTIDRARQLRMWHGSGFHQIGWCASAALYALENQLGDLAEDHRLARRLAEKLFEHRAFGVHPDKVETNMVFLETSEWGHPAIELEKRCGAAGVLAFAIAPRIVRLVVCRNVKEAEIDRAAEILVELARG